MEIITHFGTTILNQIAGPDASAVHIQFTDHLDRQHEVVGTAKRHPKDAPDPDIGMRLATGRAFKKLGEILEQEGTQLVHYADQYSLGTQ